STDADPDIDGKIKLAQIIDDLEIPGLVPRTRTASLRRSVPGDAIGTFVVANGIVRIEADVDQVRIYRVSHDRLDQSVLILRKVSASGFGWVRSQDNLSLAQFFDPSDSFSKPRPA